MNNIDTLLICNKLSNKQVKKLDYLHVRNLRQKPRYFIERLDEIEVFYNSVFRNGCLDPRLFYNTINTIPHPLSFELGHIILFYITNFLFYVDDNNLALFIDADHGDELKCNIKYIKMIETECERNAITPFNIFDSLINDPEMRERNYAYTLTYQLKLMQRVFSIIKRILSIVEKMRCDELHVIDTYMLNVCYLHFEMHREVIFFIMNQHRVYHNYSIFKNNQIAHSKYSNNNLNTNVCDNQWVHIDIPTGGLKYRYGIDKTNNAMITKLGTMVVWDNECPETSDVINSFVVQKYPVTYREYIQFIKNGGYKKKEFWSFRGWDWVVSNNKELPLNIEYDEKTDKWWRCHFNVKVEVNMKLPVVNISYYEACAYAKYMDAELLSEGEYNYLTTNGGTTLFPWGDDTNTSKYCNSCYTNDDITVVDHKYYENGCNKWGVCGLYGNCWYWTSTRFYPYDGYEVDPVYDTFSYPFFYKRYIVKGSSWCVNDTLFHSNYRNAQEPEKCFHFTGIRLKKKKK